MANFTTDGKICIERELDFIEIDHNLDDIVSRFDINETCKWIRDNNYLKVNNDFYYLLFCFCYVCLFIYSQVLFPQVCLQFPDELLNVSAKIYEELKKQIDVDFYILGDTSYAR